MVEDEIDATADGDLWGTPLASPSEPIEPVNETIEPVFTIPPIAGFWRRFAAFLLDTLMLGIVGQALGWSLSSIWFEIGPYGRFVGLLVVLTYFGLMDSRVANGQTLGKRILGVAVRDSDGQAISVGRSLLRTMIWVVPVTLNGWALPIMSNPIVATLAGFILFGIGGAILVTLIFNRRSRQGLHDMVTRAYVLYLNGQPVESLPSAARLQWVLSAVMVLLALIAVGVSGLLAAQLGEPLQEVLELHRTIQQDDRFFSASVFDQTFYESGGGTSRVLRVQVWYKGVPSDSERESIINDLAATALTVKDVESYDLVRIDVSSAYDLWFATGYIAYGDGQPVSTWRERTLGQGLIGTTSP